MPIPPFVVELRELVGADLELWLPAVTAVVRRGEGDRQEVLLTRRADNGEWAPITGILDPGEDPATGAARETLEETGVLVSVDRLVSARVSPHLVHANGDRAIYIDLTFDCTWVNGEAHVADDESVDVGWWPAADLPPMKPWLRERVDDALSGETAARFRPPSS